jgi:hypothetical protein
LLALTSLLSCHGGSPEQHEVCPRTVAAFDLRVSALSGPLPEDTRIDVSYGGALTESYVMNGDNADNQIVCCAVGEIDGVKQMPGRCGATLDAGQGQLAQLDAGAPLEIRCSVWSNGAAKVTIKGGAFTPFERTLIADEDERYPECAALRTVGASLVLGDSDAGAVFPF